VTDPTRPKIEELQRLQGEFARVAAAESAPRSPKRPPRTVLVGLAALLMVPVGFAGATEIIGAGTDPKTVDAASCANAEELRGVFAEYDRPYPDEFLGECPSAETVREGYEASRYEMDPRDFKQLKERIQERRQEGAPVPAWAEDL
jgi:hypothetical protein